MKRADITALQQSVRKWFRIAAGKSYSQGPDNCPLCKLYWHNKECAGCPVAKHTGLDCCIGTPYDTWGNLSDDEKITKDGDKEYVNSTLSKSIARAEATFLNALLPANKRVRP